MPMPSEQYRVRVTKDHLVFAAAHFITIGPDFCERLHGHNWRVAVEVTGPLDENMYVFDFIALRDAVQELVDQLDHHVLLPTRHPQINVDVSDHEVCVFYTPRWAGPGITAVSTGDVAEPTGEGRDEVRKAGSVVSKDLHLDPPPPEAPASPARRWVFPKDECCLLPIQQTTAELIARWLATRLIERLSPAGGRHLESLCVSVEENFGQWASCELRIRESGGGQKGEQG